MWILVDKNNCVSLLYFVISRQADDKHYVSLLYFVTSRQADDKHYVSLLYQDNGSVTSRRSNYFAFLFTFNSQPNPIALPALPVLY